MKHLLIVESPAKAKTIEKYLGQDFTVRASYGHIRDLIKGDKAIDIEQNFRPYYEIPKDKLDVVKELRKWADKVDEVWLATDEDREGEAISWHLAEVLNLPVDRTKRIVFNEITKTAIQKAVQEPRTIDMNLVNAQQARRVLDRLVGYELSPILWKKVKAGLSAGRVQSVAVRVLVERERDIMAFQPEPFFKVQAELAAEGKPFKAELPKRLDTVVAARSLLKQATGATYRVASLEKKPVKRKPAAPFTTSTLQQEAARKLSYPVGMTMQVAQKLYEAGHITYMRTDSTSLSGFAIKSAEETIKKEYGDAYHQVRQFRVKKGNAQEAHEAIRPTNFGARRAGSDDKERKLYDLIWKRTVASQMADAQLERTLVHVDILPPGQTTPAATLTATGEIIQFDGFLKLYLEGRDDEDEEGGATQGLLPELSVGQEVQCNELTATERFTRPPSRYTEATLVKALEELGIGRPSTYAPTISTIQRRGYVEKQSRDGEPRNYRLLRLVDQQITELSKQEFTGVEKNKLFPTDLGMLVTDFLFQHFTRVMDYSFTANVEDEFDRIAEGTQEWIEMIDSFYGPFKARVLDTQAHAERASGERGLGTDPKSGKPVLVRMGRYGPLAQIGAADDEEKRFAGLKRDQHIETISLDEALKLFDLPRTIGVYEDHDMVVNIGRFGPYIRHNGTFYSLPRGADPYEVDEPFCVDVIEHKREVERKKIIKTFDGSPLVLKKGRFGPYLEKGKDKVSLPKEWKNEAEKMALPDAEQLFEEHMAKKAEEKAAKKGKTTKTTAKATPKTAAKKGTKATAKPKTTAKKKPAAKKSTAKKPSGKASSDS